MEDLDRFYHLVKNGILVEQFLHSFAALFPAIHANGLTSAYRLGKGDLKRLRDEVTPVATFAHEHAAPTDRIQFPLNDKVPDCNVWHGHPSWHRTVETTIIQARERLNLMTELNDTGWGRGFIGITDDRPTREFKDKMMHEREAYSTEQMQSTMVQALTLCAANKAFSQAHTLVIDDSNLMESLAPIRWTAMQPALAETVKGLLFSEIYLVGRSNVNLCLRLK